MRFAAITNTSAAALLAAAPLAGQPDLAALHRDLLAAVQGESQPVAASPSLCRARGASSPLAAASPGATQSALQDWYFGSNACVLLYPSAPGAVTRATSLFGAGLTFAPADAERVRSLLERAAAAIDATTPPLRRLWLHSLAWEVGLATFPREGPTPLTCAAARLLARSRPSLGQVAALPATLARLPELSGERVITPLLVRLLAADPSLVEVWPPSDSHAEALLGRFAPRIFLTGTTASDAAAILAYLRDPARTYDTMGRLPLAADGLDAILILYWNVVDEDGTVVPTEHVAFWQQYTFSGRMRLDQPDLVQAEQRLAFRTLRYVLDPGSALPGYEPAPQDGMAHKTFVEAMPALAGSPVTVQRAICLKCHTRVVETFHPQAERAIAFEEPFSRRGRALLSRFYADNVEPRLRAWQEACRERDSN